MSKPRKPATFMRRNRSARYTESGRANMVQWDVGAFPRGVGIELTKPGEAPCFVMLQVDDAFELGDAIHHAVDRLLGI